MIPPPEAIETLRRGNRRFVAGTPEQYRVDETYRQELADGQYPFATILGCADSRVPPELIFDQRLGDLFVIRVAGNVITPAVLGSIEFAADILGTPLLIVLGHSSCGAVQGTLEAAKKRPENGSDHLQSIFDNIRPAIRPLLEEKEAPPWAELVSSAVHANVRASVAAIPRESPTLARLSAEKRLLISGAVYDLETGKVTFLPEPAPGR